MFKRKKRWIVLGLLRSILLLLVPISALIGTLLYVVRSSQPTPACLEYAEPVGEGAFFLEANPRTGTIQHDPRNYPTAWDYDSQDKVLSPKQDAFAILSVSNYAGRSALLVGVPGSEKLRQVDLQYGLTYGWSRDGNTLAYLYSDDTNISEHVVLIAPNGRRIRERVLPSFDPGRYYFAGWSADQKYFAVMTGLASDSHISSFYFISAETLEVLPRTISVFSPSDTGPGDLFWSPSGNQFAYLSIHGQAVQLRIATPEGRTQLAFDLNPQDGLAALPLVWSPDGRFIALHKRTWDENLWNNGSGPLWEYWKYDIFGADGTIHPDIIGQKWHERIDEVPDSWWSTDGHTWFFRQQRYVRGVEETPEQILSYLVAYDIDKNVYAFLAGDMAGAPLRLTSTPWLAIPVWAEDKFNVGLYNIERKVWSQLLEGSDNLPRLAWNPNAKQGTLAAIWTKTFDGKQRTYLTWANADGSGLHALNQTFDRIQDLVWPPDQRSLLVIATQRNTISIEVIDLVSATATTLAKLDGLPITTNVQGKSTTILNVQTYPSSSGRKVVINIGSADTAQDLYLISLDSSQIQQIRSGMRDARSIKWSADEQAFAFIEYDPGKHVDTLQVVSTDGVTERVIQLADAYSDLLDWVWCSPI